MFSTTFTLYEKYFAGGVTTSVPSSTIESPSSGSKSCSSSSCIPSTTDASPATFPSSNSIPWLKVPSCSCSTLITFSNVVSNTFVSESNPCTVPTWEVKVLFFENVPDTSLTTKCAIGDNSGGLDELYLNPLSLTLTDWIAPISFVTESKDAPVPVVVVTVIEGKSAYPSPPLVTCAFCIAPASVALNVADSKTIWSVGVVCVSDSSKSRPSSVRIVWFSSVPSESVPSRSKLLSRSALTRIIEFFTGAVVNVKVWPSKV